MTEETVQRLMNLADAFFDAGLHEARTSEGLTADTFPDAVRKSAAARLALESALREALAEKQWRPIETAPVMDTCSEVRSSSPTSGGGFVERELSVARGLASCRGDDARLDEVAELRAAYALLFKSEGELRKTIDGLRAQAARDATETRWSMREQIAAWLEANGQPDYAAEVRYRDWT